MEENTKTKGRVMRGERWAKLRDEPAVAAQLETIARGARMSVVAMLQLKAELGKVRRAGGYDVDIEAALAELDQVGEDLERHLAIAMARLPATRRTEHMREVEGAAASASAARRKVVVS